MSDANEELLRGLLRELKTASGQSWLRRDARQVLDGILWILCTGARWHDLPGEYPAYQTCQRRFQQ